MSAVKNEVMVSFTFDDLAIVGVIGDAVYLRGTTLPEDGPFEECIVIVTRSLLHQSLIYFLNDKAAYCERNGHFCGVMGSLRATEFEELDERHRCVMILRTARKDEDFVPVPVHTFIVTAFDPNTDMEHG
jgi:hypothetical protein